MPRSILIPAVVLPIMLIALIGWYRNRELPVFLNREGCDPTKKKWKWSIALCCLFSYLLMFWLVSMAWLQGDDWWMIGVTTWEGHISSAFHHYLDCLSRGGELFVRMVPFTFDRWPARICNGIAPALAPLALFSLCKREGESVFSRRGLVFYGFAWSLTLVNSYLPMWKNFFDLANCINHTFPCIMTAWFLSFYRNDSLQQKSSHAKCGLLFVLGILCGWGSESVMSATLPLLTLLFVAAHMHKTRRWTPHAYAGYWGMLIGNAMLFLSPALGRRMVRTLSGMKLNTELMTPDQMQDFLQNLSWENIALIRSEGVILLKDFPLFDRIWYFLPFWGEHFLKCCWFGLSVISILLITLAIQQGRAGLRTIGTGAFITCIGIGMAFIYLSSCIPSEMAFYPACFCITIAACYLFLRMSPRFCCVAASIIATGTLVLLITAGVEATQYKHYEHERWANIHTQIAEGKKDIVLPKPYPVAPCDPLGLIGTWQLGENPSRFPNNMAAGSLGVDSVKQAR